MRGKIINEKKFRKRLVLLAVIAFCILFNIKNTVSSETIQNYKTITVNKGDTLWSIASYEQEENQYYKDEDIRNIIYNIKKVNNLKSSDLSEKQNLKIPIV